MTDFQSLGLSKTLLKAVASEGYTTPTPVQEQSIPPLLSGRDVLGVAQTGTGKTAAFALPVLQIMERKKTHGKRFIRALILSPTRGLAAQIDERFAAYSEHMDVRHRVIFGGVNPKSTGSSTTKGLDILVATPGRLLDLIGQGHIDISRVEFLFLMKQIECLTWDSFVILKKYSNFYQNDDKTCCSALLCRSQSLNSPVHFLTML